MVDEAFLSGNYHTATYATNETFSQGDKPPRSQWGT